MSIRNILISGFIILLTFFFYKCYQSGYEDGIKSGQEKAEKEAAANYEPKISALESELKTLADRHKRKISGMRSSHSAKLNSSKSGHAAEMDSMQNSHGAAMDSMKNSHEAEVRSMQNAHQAELDRTRRSSYQTGQTDMKRRIDEVIDLSIENKEVPRGWNDPAPR
jgi:flagellar biosynthesis/type III secretory pathway protein FliH